MRRRVARPKPHAGPRVELARYTVDEGERILYGQRIGKIVRVSDCPACGRGRSYLVERCPARDGLAAVRALVTDYVRRAVLTDEVPMLARLVPEPDYVELARYRYCGGERVLYAQKVNGVLRVTDRPASGVGRSYLVEHDIESDGSQALRALIADYTNQAERLDGIPMRAALSPPSTGRQPESVYPSMRGMRLLELTQQVTSRSGARGARVQAEGAAR